MEIQLPKLIRIANGAGSFPRSLSLKNAMNVTSHPKSIHFNQKEIDMVKKININDINFIRFLFVFFFSSEFVYSYL